MLKILYISQKIAVKSPQINANDSANVCGIVCVPAIFTIIVPQINRNDFFFI